MQSEEQLDKDLTPETEPTVQSTVTILVIGRSGCGKTFLVDAACSDPKPSETNHSHRGTQDVESRCTTVSNVSFQLIDTPGFDNVAMSDVDVFTNIADYFLHPSRTKRGINGIIYVHRAGDTLRSRALLRNLTVLSEIFLEDTGLGRLTVFVSQTDRQQLDPAVVGAEMKHLSSTFGKICAPGANVMTSRDSRGGFLNAMMSYASNNPFLLPIQQNTSRKSCPDFAARIENVLGYYEEESVQERFIGFERQLQESFETKLRELHATLEEKDLKLIQYHDAYKHSEKLRLGQQEEGEALRQQLLQTQQEYSSLRSQLQLQDNFEQSDLVQDLKDLNRDIDDIGRSISAHLADNYVQPVFDRDVANITALDARNLSELKSLLGHVDGRSSLIVSAGGLGMDVESFFDFSIRTLLCTLLVTKIFQRFHPAIDLSHGKALRAAYLDIQLKEPQSVAGKWRSSTFKSIYRPENPDTTKAFIDKLTRDFVRNRLSPFITHFFGQKDVGLERHHFDRLHQLVKRSWDWNSKLKGEVIMLGDFDQTAFVPCSRFDSTWMEEFEPNPRMPPAKTILGTLALGLVSRRAVGGGQPPEETVVCKALVATNNLYA